MASRDRTAQPIPLQELIERLRALAAAGDPVEQAKLARELASTSGPTIVTLKAVGDEAIWRAVQGGMKYAQVQEALGYGSRSRVSDAVSRHNRRRRGELGVDRMAE